LVAGLEPFPPVQFVDIRFEVLADRRLVVTEFWEGTPSLRTLDVTIAFQ
jgi:hypothetical protein